MIPTNPVGCTRENTCGAGGKRAGQREREGVLWYVYLIDSLVNGRVELFYMRLQIISNYVILYNLYELGGAEKYHHHATSKIHK